MRLISDGIVDREGVAGLARRVHVSERHLHRILLAEVGAGPQALARARRAETARVLIETTDVSFGEAAFAAGFASIRQFNDTVRSVFALTPTELRRRAARTNGAAPGTLVLRLAYRSPFDGEGLLRFLGDRTVAGLDERLDGSYRRTIALPHSDGIAELSVEDGYVRCALRLEDLRDLTAAVRRCRDLLDLDADPIAVGEHLRRDPLLRTGVRRVPGRRVPRTVDPAEHAIRAVLGQQISVARACSLAAGLVAEHGKPLTRPDGSLTHTFPTAETLAELDPSALPMPRSRAAAVVALSRAIASGAIELDLGADRAETMERLLAIKGIGAWTASYIAMRGLGDPDAFPASDLGIVKAFERSGIATDPRSIVERAERWRPWRAYATQYLWATLG